MKDRKGNIYKYLSLLEFGEDFFFDDVIEDVGLVFIVFGDIIFDFGILIDKFINILFLLIFLEFLFVILILLFVKFEFRVDKFFFGLILFCFLMLVFKVLRILVFLFLVGDSLYWCLFVCLFFLLWFLEYLILDNVVFLLRELCLFRLRECLESVDFEFCLKVFNVWFVDSLLEVDDEVEEEGGLYNLGWFVLW